METVSRAGPPRGEGPQVPERRGAWHTARMQYQEGSQKGPEARQLRRFTGGLVSAEEGSGHNCRLHRRPDQGLLAEPVTNRKHAGARTPRSLGQVTWKTEQVFLRQRPLQIQNVMTVQETRPMPPRVRNDGASGLCRGLAKEQTFGQAAVSC